LAAPADAAATCAAAVAMAESYQRGGLPITARHGHAVVELLPTGVSKGKTSCVLLSLYAPSALAVYIGDDATDDDAFNSLPADAITIRVGAAAVSTAARYRVDDPRSVHRFLYAVLKCRQARPTAPNLADGRNQRWAR
jgi:trehalose-phosphatase